MESTEQKKSGNIDNRAEGNSRFLAKRTSSSTPDQ